MSYNCSLMKDNLKYYNQICHLLQQKVQNPSIFPQRLITGSVCKLQAASDRYRLFIHMLRLLV